METKKIIKEISIQAKYGDERSQLHIKYAIRFFFNTLLFFLIQWWMPSDHLMSDEEIGAVLWSDRPVLIELYSDS